LGSAVTAGEAEAPVIDLGSAADPFVGPGEHEGAGADCGKRGADLPVQRPRLRLLSVPEAVEPQLAYEQGAVARDVLEAGEIGLQSFPLFQVDVEAHQIQEGEL